MCKQAYAIRILLVFLGFLSCSICQFAAAQDKNGTITIDSVFERWAQKQKRVKTVKFQWTAELVIGKGAAGPGGAPPQETTIVYPSALYLDGDKMRYTNEGSQWQDNQFIRMPYVSVFDGESSKTYRSSSEMPGQGVVYGEKKNRDVVTFNTYPILLAYRPVHDQMGFFRDDYVILPTPAVIDGHQCIVIEESSKTLEKRKTNNPKSALVKKTWCVDSERDFAIVRYALTRDDKPSLQITISYALEKPGEWAPSSWQIIFLKQNGALMNSVSAKVTSHQINEPIDIEDFRLVFPQGTQVADLARNVNYKVGAEEKKTQLFAPREAPPMPKQETARTGLPLLGLSVAAALFAALFYFVRRRSLRR